MTCFILEQQRDIFSVYDRTGDGKVWCADIGDILRVLGCNPTDADVKKIRSEFDPTGTGMYFIQSCNVLCSKC